MGFSFTTLTSHPSSSKPMVLCSAGSRNSNSSLGATRPVTFRL
ncbi:hypothetical protein RB653_001345 [Dictyostelium firmibasis]|uniref:Uncharacterized protein n=1 Tax=Dictyostelium firmibasis TaxID=79012 RepID=A0AAN7YRD8_9MYCE